MSKCTAKTLVIVYNVFLADIVGPLIYLVAVEAQARGFTALLALLVALVVVSPAAAALPTIYVLRRACRGD